jgi:hypothetical protein
LCASDPGAPLANFDEYFKMKEGSIQVPTFYLSAKLKKAVLPNGVVAWGMSSSKYVESDVHNVKEYLAALPGEQKLMRKASGPFAWGYKPELDESPELDSTRANFYQSHIGILRWCVELGFINIITEVSMLSTYLSLPSEGHLEAVFHVLAYLGLHDNARVAFDPTHPAADMGTFIKTGAEFFAIKNGIETCRGLLYKLRMMGVALSGPIFVYGDNMSVVHNTQRPESVLKKKSN